MSKVKVTKSFTMSLEEVREGIEKLALGLKDEHGMKYDWQGDDKVNFSHKMAKGWIEIQGSELVLELKLGMLYAAMAPMVKSQIVKMADEHIS